MSKRIGTKTIPAISNGLREGEEMKVEDVRRRVKEIDEMADLVERAHAAEDKLHRDVLRAIADGIANPVDLAHAALATEHLGLDRYYANAESPD